MNTCTMESSLAALLSLYLDGKNISLEDVQESLCDLKQVEETPIFLEQLFLISMYQYVEGASFNEELLALVSKVAKDIHFNNKDLGDANLFCKWALIKVLLGEKVFFDQELYSLVKVEGLSKLQHLANIAVMSFFIGMIGKDNQFVELGCRIAEMIIPFMKENGEVDVLFLHEKGTYEKDKCRVLVFILMTIYQELTDQNVRGFLPRLDPYVGGLFQTIDVEKRLLCRLLKKLEHFMSTHNKMCRTYIEPEQRIYKQTGGFSFLTSKGKKVGLGSVSYEGEIIVPSFGPHVLPLGKSDLYGLQSPLTSEMEEHGSFVKMWNRVKSFDSYGDHWVYSNLECLESSLKLESFLWSKEMEDALSLVFFVRGNSICIEGKEYKSGGLERVYEKSDKVIIHQGGRSFVFQTGFAIAIEVIPLAGQEFFWNSDFIISFPYHERSLLSIEIFADEKG